MSRNSSERHPPDGPPVCTALNGLNSPPPISKIIFLSVVPIGTSISPVRRTRPTRENVFVPLQASVPKSVYQSAPRRMIFAIVPRVSTLLIIVGLPHNPATAGNGGRVRGIPLLPSIEAISAVSSPQTKAPAPSFILISRLNPEPRIFSPISPSSSIWEIAFSRRLIASGYSARI